MVLSAFPWSDVILSISTLLGAVVGAVVVAVLTRRTEATRWRLEAQREAAAGYLAEVQDAYLRLQLVARGKSDKKPSWASKSASLDRLLLVAEPSLAEAAVRLDRQVWQLSLAVDHIDHLTYSQWVTLAGPWVDAWKDVVQSARSVLGDDRTLDDVGGRPAADDPVWTKDYWLARASTLGVDPAAVHEGPFERLSAD